MCEPLIASALCPVPALDCCGSAQSSTRLCTVHLYRNLLALYDAATTWRVLCGVVLVARAAGAAWGDAAGHTGHDRKDEDHDATYDDTCDGSWVALAAVAATIGAADLLSRLSGGGQVTVRLPALALLRERTTRAGVNVVEGACPRPGQLASWLRDEHAGHLFVRGHTFHGVHERKRWLANHAFVVW